MINGSRKILIFVNIERNQNLLKFDLLSKTVVSGEIISKKYFLCVIESFIFYLDFIKAHGSAGRSP